MKVININGTNANKCKCDSWLTHWIKFSGESAIMCVESICLKTDLVGAHIQKENADDKNWYIIPLCTTHNALKGESIIIADSTKLIPANVNETCGKE